VQCVQIGNIPRDNERRDLPPRSACKLVAVKKTTQDQGTMRWRVTMMDDFLTGIYIGDRHRELGNALSVLR
jgi:hypothetical protein